MHLAFPFYESNILIISFLRLEASRNEGRYISGCSVTLQTDIDIASFKYSVIMMQSIQERGARFVLKMEPKKGKLRFVFKSFIIANTMVKT